MLEIYSIGDLVEPGTYDYLNGSGWAMLSLPWVGQELAETRELMGDNYWPYGIAPNRKA